MVIPKNAILLRDSASLVRVFSSVLSIAKDDAMMEEGGTSSFYTHQHDEGHTKKKRGTKNERSVNGVKKEEGCNGP